MNTIYRLTTLFALTLSALGADVKFSALPTATSPSTNSYLPIIDLNLLPAAQNQKYLLTNLATVSYVNSVTNQGLISGLVSNNVASAGLLAVDSTKTNGIAATAAMITNLVNSQYVLKAGDTMTGALTASGELYVSNGGALGWAGANHFYSGAYGDGVIAAFNFNNTDFTALIFGPNDASHIRLKRVGTNFVSRLGDDSADAGFVSNGAPLYEGKLATVAAVDVNTTGKTTLYTVPTGKTLIVTKVVVRNAWQSLTTASFGFGFNAGGDDVVSSATHTELTGSTLYTEILPKSGAALGTAGSVFGLKCSIAQGVAATVDVDIFGFFY